MLKHNPRHEQVKKAMGEWECIKITASQTNRRKSVSKKSILLKDVGFSKGVPRRICRENSVVGGYDYADENNVLA